jgi:hypothetical protein
LRLPAVAFLILLLPCIANPAGIADERVSMSQKMAEAIVHSGVHNLYVADFCDSNSRPIGPGGYFAAIFSTLLQKPSNGLTVVSRVAAHNFLLENQWTDCDLGKTDVLGKFAAALGVDAILTGGVTLEKNYFFVDLILRDASGKPQIHWVYQEPYSPYTLSAFPASASSAGWPFYFPALDGVTYPKPIKLQHPPNPPDKLGVVVISILVTTDGNVDQARVVRS